MKSYNAIKILAMLTISNTVNAITYQYGEYNTVYPRDTTSTWYTKLWQPRPEGLQNLRNLVHQKMINNDPITDIVIDHYDGQINIVQHGINQSNKKISERLTNYWKISGMGTRQALKTLFSLTVAGVAYTQQKQLNHEISQEIASGVYEGNAYGLSYLLREIAVPLSLVYGIYSATQIITQKQRLIGKKEGNKEVETHITSSDFKDVLDKRKENRKK